MLAVIAIGKTVAKYRLSCSLPGRPYPGGFQGARLPPLPLSRFLGADPGRAPGSAFPLLREGFPLLALAQFERRLTQERTRADLAAARARGRLGGRPAQNPRVQMAKALYKDRVHTVGDICHTLHSSRSTLYRYLALPDG